MWRSICIPGQIVWGQQESLAWNQLMVQLVVENAGLHEAHCGRTEKACQTANVLLADGYIRVPTIPD